MKITNQKDQEFFDLLGEWLRGEHDITLSYEQSGQGYDLCLDSQEDPDTSWEYHVVLGENVVITGRFKTPCEVSRIPAAVGAILTN